jgi:DNA-binding winged helix-turn-helix (wHTH) protein
MSNDLIAGARYVHEQRIADRSFEGSSEVWLAGAFKTLTPQLLTLFRASGCDPTLSEALAKKVVLQLTTSLPVALRRTNMQDAREPVLIQVGNLKLDLERRLFWRGDDEVHLSPKEFDLLALMMKNVGVPLTHAKLLRSVWGVEYGGELEYLRTYVRILRKKVEKIPANPEYIVSEPWFGYRFRCPSDPEPTSVQNQ